MTRVINFKKSQYFVFKKHLEASCGGIALHTKESFGESTWYDPRGFKEDGYVLFISEGSGETECDLFLKYSPEGKLIEFRLLYCQDQEWVGWYKNDNITDPFKKEEYLIQECELYWGQGDNNKDKPYKISSIHIDSVETSKGGLIFEGQVPYSGTDDDEADEPYFNPDEHLNIKCENGIYDIYEVELEQPKINLPWEDVQIHLPCCHKIIDFNFKFLKERWGVLNLHCEGCDKYHVAFDDYLWNNKQRIDFYTAGIKGGYKDKKETKPYGWIGYLKKDDEDKPEFKFMFED